VTRTLDDCEVSGRVVLVRSDFNVPTSVSDGVVSIVDDGRIQAGLPTISWLADRGARVVVLAHMGRPKGMNVPELSLAPVAIRLSELLGKPVAFAPTSAGLELTDRVAEMSDGDVLMCENVRFDARETSKDPRERQERAREWAHWADVFVSDGFGVVHREQASVTDIAALLPHAAGRLVESELASFSRVLADPQRPYVVVLGGSKVSDKLGVISHLLDRVDQLLIGGGMAFTFLAAQGFDVGRSLLDESMIETVRAIMAEAAERGVDLQLPVDVVVAPEIAPDAPTRVVSVSEIPEGWMGLDIGPHTAGVFADAVSRAATVVWNGPMGVFEIPAFAEGTAVLARALSQSSAFTVVGGGDSAAAIRVLGIDEKAFAHISTGGGASLELLEGRALPGLAILEEDS
jgi:phosphoglycerate kinase